jgi:hypothetical protein
MINVTETLLELPSFRKFCSVAELSTLVETIRRESTQVDVRIAGTSAGGSPIHHVRFGSGRIKALFVGWPHPNEPIGGLTIFGLLSLLRQHNRQLLDADVEWHIVPCIDPDGAILNEGWTQQPFTIGNFMRNSYRQEPCDQVERSFPIQYKRAHFDRPIKEAQLLQALLATIRPDFFYSMHNARLGAVSFFLSSAIDERYYRQLQELAQTYRIPLLQVGSPLLGGHAQFAPGVWELFSARKYYDYLETVTDHPEEGLHQAGGCSWEYLAQIKSSALTFVQELPYLQHPGSVSTKETSQHLRHFMLRSDADNKFLITVILEEWDQVKDDVDPASPFYRKILHSIVAVKDKLVEGLPSWESGTSDLLANPSYSKMMTEADLFRVCMKRFYVLCNSHEIVRLLKQSKQTPAVTRATRRLESLYDEALAELAEHVDFDAFKVVEHDSLARMHLGGGLIVLNSVLEANA